MSAQIWYLVGCLAFATAAPFAGAFAEASPVCGDGTVDEGEECDDGEGNGTTLSCCQLDCTFRPLDTSCGDPTSTECDASDTCDDAGVCLSNLAPLGASCGSQDDSECDHPDQCDEMGLCQSNFEPDFTLCTDDGIFCNGDNACQDGLCESPESSPCLGDCDEPTNQCIPFPVLFADDFESGDFSAWTFFLAWMLTIP